MAEHSKYYLDIQKKFASKNQKEILKAIKGIRQSGKANIIPLVIDLLNDNKENEIGKEILGLLGQLRDKAAISYIIDSVKSSKNNSFKSELIASCWQSGLDYSDHILVFTEEFIRGDYKVSIEAFSVIEEWIPKATKEIIAKCKNHLKNSADKILEEKKTFYLELVSLVDSCL